MAEKADNVYMAKLAEQAERYDDMVEAMKKVVNNHTDLSVEERNLLSVAYKNVIGSRRASWRILSTLKSKEKDKTNDSKSYLKIIDEYIDKVEKELGGICDDVLVLLTKIIGDKPDNEAMVFYQKMKGDYHRYKAEYLSGTEKANAAEEARLAYKEASEKASDLPPTNPISLGLALNYSVFFYEILDNPDEACKLAKKAFDDAIAELDTLKEESYKDSTLIMQLLRDNLTLWTSDIPDDEGNKDGTQIEDIEQDGS